ncbi:MAG: hypothetical protein GX797_10350, partial [Chloroflexi bacterium]|nr:hypothetical protein [Chloroflexota bacterium]
PYTIHAGEGLELASSLEDAIKCSPIRIGHGIASVFDKSLIEEIKEKRIALELCVSSNLKTFNIPFNIYPLAEIFDSGVDILLGSDNPSFINSNIENEYDLVASILGDQVLERIESTTNKYLRNRNLV